MSLLKPTFKYLWNKAPGLPKYKLLSESRVFPKRKQTTQKCHYPKENINHNDK